MTHILWHNAEWRNEGEALYGFTNRLRYGDGVFDTMLILDGTPIHAPLHYERLRDNALLFGFQDNHLPDQADFMEIIQAIIQRNKALQGRYALNTVISRGESARGLKVPEKPAPTLSMRLSHVPLVNDPVPIHAWIAKTVRRNEGSPLSRIKSCNYGDNILALQEAINLGYNEAILLNNRGDVCCASSSNLFVIKEGRISTPPLSDGVLNGTARTVFMQKYSVSENSITQKDLLGADALFLTNSIRGGQYIESINGQSLPGTDLPLGKDFYIE